MIFKILPFRRALELTASLLLSIMLAATGAQAEIQDVTVGLNANCNQPDPATNPDISYAAAEHGLTKPGGGLANDHLGVLGASGDVQWDFSLLETDPGSGTCEQDTADPKIQIVHCGGLNIELPNEPNKTAPQANKVTVKGNPPQSVLGAGGHVTLKVTDSAVGNACASRRYYFHTTSNGGGWGDPHKMTVDGVHYDFQSAGDFTALREDPPKAGALSRFEVVTRQTPVPTTTVPGPGVYTDLPLCVAIYSAVAARIGSNIVSLEANPSKEPNLRDQPDPKILQLFVNKKPVPLTEDSAHPLCPDGKSECPADELEGNIKKSKGVYVFTDKKGTQLVATPNYWEGQQTWYMNLNVYQTSGTKGIWGRLAKGSWLPALPDGTSLGSKPEGSNQRYQELYVTFAGKWKGDSSLFFYPPRLAVDHWPPYNPRMGQSESCLIPGKPSADPTDPQTATQKCSRIKDPAQKADCAFDVTVTGNTDFAKTYETMQAFQPNGPGWQPALASVGQPSPSTKPWWLWILILAIIIAVLIAWRRRTP